VPESETQVTLANVLTQAGSEDGDCRGTLDTEEDLSVDINDEATLLLDVNDILAAPDEVALDPIDNEFNEFEQGPLIHIRKVELVLVQL
jgi:hypothetical protein